MKRLLSFFMGIVMTFSCIMWLPNAKVHAEDTMVTITQNVGEAVTGSCVRKWNDESWTFYTEGEFATYVFDVPVSGKYQFVHTGSINGEATFSVLVDRVLSETMTLIGSDLNTEINTITSVYYFEAGQHRVTFTYKANEVETAMYKVSLEQLDDTTVIAQQDHDKDTVTTTGYSDYSTDEETGFIAFWDNQTVTFNSVNIPKSGAYGVYVDGGANADGNSWAVAIDGQSISGTIPNTSDITKMVRTKIGTLDLSAGEKTLELSSEVAEETNLSMLRIVLVWESSILLKTSNEVTGSQYQCGRQWGTNWGFYDAGDYATYTFDVAESGTYKLLITGAINGTSEFGVEVDRIASNAITFNGTDAEAKIEVEAGSYYMEAGSHTVIYRLKSGTDSTLIYTIQLKKLDDTLVVAQQYYDKDAVTSTAYSDYSEDKVSGFIAFWDAQTVTFSDVMIPEGGTYGVYIDAGSNADNNSWTVNVDGQSVEKSIANTTDITTMNRTKLGTVDLYAGAKTLELTGQVVAGTNLSMLRIVLVREKVMIIKTSDEVTGEQYQCSRQWGTNWGFYDEGDYATYTFDVQQSGKYELEITGAINGTSEFSIEVDRVVANTITFEGTDTDAKILVNAGSYYLETGSHTVTYRIKAGTDSTLIYTIALKQLDDTIVLAQQDHDKDAVTTNAYSDFSIDEIAGYIAFWDNQTVTFGDVEIPKDGTYGIYVDGGSDTAGNRWAVKIDEQSVSESIPNTENILTMARTKLGTMALTTGTKTIQLSSNVAAGTNLSMIRVVLIYEGIMLSKTSDEVTDNQYQCTRQWGTNWGFYDSGDYATYTFNVPQSGKYELVITGAINGTSEFSIEVDRVVSDAITFTGTDAEAKIAVEAGSYYIEAGSHTVTYRLSSRTETTLIYDIILKQVEETVIIANQYYDKDAVSTDGYSDYSEDKVSGFLAFWDSQTVTFYDVTISQEGVYGVYVDAGSDAADNRWAVKMDDQTVSKTISNTDDITKMVRTKLGTIDLKAGTKTLTLSGTVASSKNLSVLRVILVREGDIVEKVLDEDAYTCYTLSDAGIADGKGIVYGKLLDAENEEVSAGKYDKALFSGKVTFANSGSRIHYATNMGDIYNGIQIRLQDDGSLILEDYSSETREVLTYDAMVMEPAQFGFETFAGQSFTLQLTTDVVAQDSTTADDIQLGIWIDGTLANNKYCYILNQLEQLGSSVNFTEDVNAVHYSLWEIDAPAGKMENYIKITDEKPYLVEADTFTNTKSSVSYGNGEVVNMVGDYKASYDADENSQSGEKSVVLWRAYDTHADNEYDVRDLVAMKRAAAGANLESKAGQMAASQLECEVDCDTFRAYLIGRNTTLEEGAGAIYYQTDAEGKVMPISGWVTPSVWLDFKLDATGSYTENYMPYDVETDFLQDKYYLMIQDLGINLLAYQEKNYAEHNEMQILKGLSMAEKYGMNFYVHDSGIADDEDDERILAERIKAYSRYSSFAGIHVTDEPKTDSFNADKTGAYISDIKNKTSFPNLSVWSLMSILAACFRLMYKVKRISFFVASASNARYSVFI